MARLRSVLVSGLLAAGVNAQNYDGSGRAEDAFSWVQPKNTTILGQYGHSPEVPRNNATGAGWEDAFVKAKEFVSKLTLEEKALMVTGTPGPCVGNIPAIERVGFNGLCLQDGPLAIRVADYASVFQAGVSAASSWDKKLLYERGLAMGQEFKAKGAHILLGPVAGPLGRSAYSGRNWEGFSPDPYLTGVAMEETIMGHQDAGVQATPKHFIGNEQEVMRNPTFVKNGYIGEVKTEALSANMDDRTMHELYLWPFANAVHAKASSMMCSYQRLNGSYGCQNSKTLNGILKQELGFQGYVMSDWGATHSGVAAINAGQDMDMPGGIGQYGMTFTKSFFGGNLTKAVTNGTLDETRVDDMIHRIMAPYFWLSQDRKDFPTIDPSGADLSTFSPKKTWFREFNLTGERSRDVRGNHGDLIRKHGAESTVLLKNKNNALPLQKPKSIAIFGNDAGYPTQGFLNQKDYEFGTLVAGGGSGTGRLTYIVTPLDAINARAKKDGSLVQTWLNNTLIATSNVTDLWIPTPPEVCLVFLKTWAEEAADREHLSVDWHGDDVVKSVAKSCNNTIVVTHSSGINTLPWADHPNVTAILAAHFPGQESGNSLVDLLYGDVNPSGRLPYTIAFNGTDYNAPPTTAVNTTGKEDWQSWFDEKLEIDYRYFDAKNISVRYEFGFGLSYSTFEISDISAEPIASDITAQPEDRPVQPGGNPALWEGIYNVTISLANTGKVDGATVPQLYVTFPESTPAGTPPKQLRGFEKVFLKAGEKKSVGFELMRRDLSYWDIISQKWVIPEGEFTIRVGFSSRDLKQEKKITVTSLFMPQGANLTSIAVSDKMDLPHEIRWEECPPELQETAREVALLFNGQNPDNEPVPDPLPPVYLFSNSSVEVGYFRCNLPFEPSIFKSDSRKRKAKAYLMVKRYGEKDIGFLWCDAGGNAVDKQFIKKIKGFDLARLKKELTEKYNEREEVIVRSYNERLAITIARRMIVKFAARGTDGVTPPVIDEVDRMDGKMMEAVFSNVDDPEWN
ncbi:beta-glucosidase G [Fusarium austroafricanum]|uniref:Beta-glucosidase cel3A n=1 Tax=Fusarium austroafricanum TaxID=2364996 RepID=A0A8H4NUH5_9HYPO|nr:beta-glucosidase G [Fusarium austroafricanum]